MRRPTKRAARLLAARCSLEALPRDLARPPGGGSLAPAAAAPAETRLICLPTPGWVAARAGRAGLTGRLIAGVVGLRLLLLLVDRLGSVGRETALRVRGLFNRGRGFLVRTEAEGIDMPLLERSFGAPDLLDVILLEDARGRLDLGRPRGALFLGLPDRGRGGPLLAEPACPVLGHAVATAPTAAASTTLGSGFGTRTTVRRRRLRLGRWRGAPHLAALARLTSFASLAAPARLTTLARLAALAHLATIPRLTALARLAGPA